MAEKDMTKFDAFMGSMDAAAENPMAEDDKRMSDDELDLVAGGYSYGMMQRTVGRNGQVTYKMYNQNTRKYEVYTGANQREAMAKMVRHNLDQHQNTIVLNGANGERETWNVKELAREIGIYK